jgi:hypothetical protein
MVLLPFGPKGCIYVLSISDDEARYQSTCDSLFIDGHPWRYVVDSHIVNIIQLVIDRLPDQTRSLIHPLILVKLATSERSKQAIQIKCLSKPGQDGISTLLAVLDLHLSLDSRGVQLGLFGEIGRGVDLGRLSVVGDFAGVPIS